MLTSQSDSQEIYFIQYMIIITNKLSNNIWILQCKGNILVPMLGDIFFNHNWHKKTGFIKIRMWIVLPWVKTVHDNIPITDYNA